MRWCIAELDCLVSLSGSLPKAAWTNSPPLTVLNSELFSLSSDCNWIYIIYLSLWHQKCDCFLTWIYIQICLPHIFSNTKTFLNLISIILTLTQLVVSLFLTQWTMLHIPIIVSKLQYVFFKTLDYWIRFYPFPLILFSI